MKYSRKDGETVAYFLSQIIPTETRLIGSLAKKGFSNNDIDILLPNIKRTVRLRNKLMMVLAAKKYTYTDWGGIYFHNTFFGDIDIFFADKNFDY